MIESKSGKAHAIISAKQRQRRRENGYNTTIKYEFNISYREMIDAGIDSKTAKKAIAKSYKYFDELGAFKK